MAMQVTLHRSPIEACGCCCQVHCWWNIDTGSGLALFSPLVAYQFPGSQVERQRGELSSTRVKVNAVQVMTQNAVGDFRGRESWILLPVHGDEHIEGFAQEVATAHAGIKHAEAGKIECC